MLLVFLKNWQGVSFIIPFFFSSFFNQKLTGSIEGLVRKNYGFSILCMCSLIPDWDSGLNKVSVWSWVGHKSSEHRADILHICRPRSAIWRGLVCWERQAIGAHSRFHMFICILVAGISFTSWKISESQLCEMLCNHQGFDSFLFGLNVFVLFFCNWWPHFTFNMCKQLKKSDKMKGYLIKGVIGNPIS